MSTIPIQFDAYTVLNNWILQRTQATAAQNAAAVAAYTDASKQWIDANVISRDRAANVNFVPSPLPSIPHKMSVDQTTGADVDLGPFPDLQPPVLPPYLQSTSGTIQPMAKPTVDPMAAVLVMLQQLQTDIQAIRKKVGA